MGWIIDRRQLGFSKFGVIKGSEEMIYNIVRIGGIQYTNHSMLMELDQCLLVIGQCIIEWGVCKQGNVW